MKVMFIKFFKNEKEDNQVLMKDLRQKNFSDYFDEIRHNNIKRMHNIKENKFFKKLKNFQNSKLMRKNQLALFAISLMLVTASYMNYSNKLRRERKTQVSSTALVSTSSSSLEENTSNIEKGNNHSSAQINENDSIQVAVNQDGETQINENQNVIQAADNQDSKTQINENQNTIQASANQDGETQINENKNTIQTSANQDGQTQINENKNAIQANSNGELQAEKNTKSNTAADDYFSAVRLERDKSYSQMLETYTNILKDSNVPNDQKSIASNEIKKINDRRNQISTIENLLKGKGFEDLIIMINDNSIDAIIKSDQELNNINVAQIENIVSRELNADIEDIHITIHK